MKALCLLTLLSFPSFAQMENQFLSFGEAEKIWNLEPFDSAKFRAAKPDDRAGMALDIMNRGHFTDKKLVDVKKALGNPDGHFDTRYSLAYLLGSDDKNSYQLIFLPDYAGKTVENIKILHEPIPDAAPAKPIAAAATNISAQSKRLPIEIDGALAQSIYQHMHRVSESKSLKTGKNIACAKNSNTYHCSFELDDQGAAFAK